MTFSAGNDVKFDFNMLYGPFNLACETMNYESVQLELKQTILCHWIHYSYYLTHRPWLWKENFQIGAPILSSDLSQNNFWSTLNNLYTVYKTLYMINCISYTVYQKLKGSMTELNDRIKVNQKAFITQVNLLISFKTSKWWILKPQVTCLLWKLTWYATCAGHKRSEHFLKNLKTINIASYNLRLQTGPEL